MSLASDQYRTLATASPESLFKDRGSKFYGYAFPVQSEEAIKQHLENLRAQHHQARHWCYAWQLGTSHVQYRYNDDGEPSNSAGAPIYGQIQSFDLTDVLIVVVRYFGGTKLGVGGLINAYRAGAKLALEEAEIVIKTIKEQLHLSFDYPKMNVVMRLIKEEQLEIVAQKMELKCHYTLAIPKSKIETLKQRFESIYGVEVKKR